MATEVAARNILALTPAKGNCLVSQCLTRSSPRLIARGVLKAGCANSLPRQKDRSRPTRGFIFAMKRVKDFYSWLFIYSKKYCPNLLAHSKLGICLEKGSNISAKFLKSPICFTWDIQLTPISNFIFLLFFFNLYITVNPLWDRRHINY